MEIRRLIALVALVGSAFTRAAFAGEAQPAPGAHRPDWVIGVALAVVLVLLVAAVVGTVGGWSRGSKFRPPYF